MRKKVLCVAVTGLALLATACSTSRSGGDSAQTQLPAGTNTGSSASGSSGNSADCSGQSLTATDIGVTPTTFTIEVMADTGASSIPGMANGSVEAVKAWAKLVNSQGGLACRQVQVRTFDSKIDPTQSAAGFADGCENALAMVGDFAMAVADVSTLDNCKDKSGAATGLPEAAAVALNPLQACNKTTYLVGGNVAPCPPGTGERTFTESSVYSEFLKTVLKSDTGHGVYYVALTPPVIKDSAVPQNLYMAQQGMKIDQMVGLPATATQANFTPIIAKAKSAGSQFYFSNAVFTTFLQAKAEAAVQGISDKMIWFCQATCYDPAFIKAGGAAADGTYVAINTLPYEESANNAEVKAFTDNVKTHNTFSIASWLSARLFETAIKDLVKTKGPNALTRANVLAALDGVKDFTDGGMIGPVTPSAHTPPNCSVVVQATSSGFKRVWPTKPGTLQCGTTGTITVNPETAFKG